MNRVEICGVNTSEIKVLSEKEKEALLKKIKSGDTAAREEFLTGNLKLVLSVIKRFSGRGESADDLFQIGCIGLIKALDNFDVTQNVKFSTYAVPMIIGEIRRYLRDNNAVRVSRSMRDTAYKALSVKEEMQKKLQRDPTAEEIAKELSLPRRDVVVAMEAIVDPVSLFDPVYNDDSDSLYIMDQIRDKKETDSGWIEEISIKQAVASLSEREKNILSLRFYGGKTQTEVAKQIGISQSKVSRLEKSALSQIKNYL